jgi:TRAP-type C4-dicarboxylate transport system permease small subunit
MSCEVAGMRCYLGKIEEIIAGIFMVLMSVCTVGNVIARYVFNSPIAWAEEFARYAFVWVVFLGAVACTKQKRHIVIDALTGALPRRIRAGVLAFADLLVIGLMAALIYYGWIFTTMSTEPTSMMEIPQYLIYVAVPLSAVLVIFYTLRDIRRNMADAVGGGDEQ